MSFSIFCNVGTSFVFSALDHSPDSRMILFLLTIPILLLVSNDDLLRPCLFLRIDIKSPRSVMKCFSVPYGLRSSVVKNFLVRETKSNYSCRSKNFHQVAPIDRISQDQFSTLEKTKHGRHPTLSSLLWREALHKLFMVIVIESFQLVYSFFSPGLLKSKTIRTTASWQ